MSKPSGSSSLPSEFFPQGYGDLHFGIEDELKKRDQIKDEIKTLADYAMAYSAGFDRACQFLLCKVPMRPQALNLFLIQYLHEILYSDLFHHAGQWRKVGQLPIFGGHIGADANSILPECRLLHYQTKALTATWRSPALTDKEVSDRLTFIAFYHARLIFVHPFCDGNGRLARLVARWQEWCAFPAHEINVLSRTMYMSAMSALPHDLGPLANYFSFRYDRTPNRFGKLVPPFPIKITQRPDF